VVFRILSPFSVLSQPGVARLWAIGVLSGVVRWLEILAFALVALDLTGSPIVVASTTVLRMLPQLLLSMPIAALAEGRDSGRVLRGALGGMAALWVVLLALAWAGLASLPVLLAAALIGGAFNALEGTLRRMMLADAGGPARIGAAIGLDAATGHLTRATGAVLGGVAVATVGLIGVFGVAVVCYALAMVLVPLAASAPAGAPAPARFLANLVEAFRSLRGNRLLAGVMLITVAFNLFGFPYVALVPVMGEEVLGLGSVGIGLLLAVEAVGAALGALALGAIEIEPQLRRLYVLGTALFMVGTLAFAVVAAPGPSPYVLFGAGLGMAAFNIAQTILPLQAVEPALRLRAFALVMTGIGVAPFGFAYAGLLGELLGAPLAIQALAVQGLVMTGLVVRWCPELLGRHRPVGSSDAQLRQ